MNLRVIATAILTKVIKDGQSLTVALDYALDAVPGGKDRAFIQALSFGVLRQYHQLDFILQQLLSKSIRNKDTDIKVLLLIGLYQLKYMRVKSHAAVSETVVAAKKKSWAKSLINGVLRQYLREQETFDKLADDNFIAYHSHPQWLVDIIKQSWPEQFRSILQENNKQAPMVLRVNLAQTTRDEYLEKLEHNAIVASLVPFCSTAIVLKQAVLVEQLPGFSDGMVSVQDTAAQLSAELLDVQISQSVLDLCAAPGGKTAAILERQTQIGSMLAVDVDETRLMRVTENLQRLKLQAQTLVGDASDSSQWANGQLFDRILVDAPCSALGVIRRHPDIKLLRRESDIAELQALQKNILNEAWKLLLPGGVLLYATCSILKQENEAQIELFLSSHADAHEVLIEGEWGIKRPFGRQVLTGKLEMDGFYYAKLSKM